MTQNIHKEGLTLIFDAGEILGMNIGRFQTADFGRYWQLSEKPSINRTVFHSLVPLAPIYAKFQGSVLQDIKGFNTESHIRLEERV